MIYKLVADSSANVYSMPLNYANVPLTINTANDEFVDDGTLDVADMVERIRLT